jgi:hypothetical protein
LNKTSYIKQRRKKATIAIFLIFLFGISLYGFSNKKKLIAYFFKTTKLAKEKNNYYLKNFFENANENLTQNIFKESKIFFFKKINKTTIQLNGVLKIKSLHLKINNPIFKITTQSNWNYAVFLRKLDNNTLNCKGIFEKESSQIIIYTCFID